MTAYPRLPREATLAALPDEPAECMREIQAVLAAEWVKVVVLDDDPTGTQTVHDVRVLTQWAIETLTVALADPAPAVFILTNTRAMTQARAEALNGEIAANLRAASEATGRQFVVVSRSDSTLRGHFPAETKALAQALPGTFDGVLIVPAFMAGGRFTIDSVHYVAEGEQLIPAGQTPFAEDATFGYSASNLRVWVAEKTAGCVPAEDVAVVTLDDIRRQGVEHVTGLLLALTDGQYCAVDAVTERDLQGVVLACLKAEQQGKRYLYRTAASFAAIRAGIAPRPLLTTEELSTQRQGGGLVVVGSYVPKSSAQLAHLLENTTITGVEIHTPALLDDTTCEAERQRVINAALPVLESDGLAVVYTSRDLITGDSADSSLAIGNRVSASLVSITKHLQHAARFLIAKGGITSSDLATEALKVKQARVMGQILPGIPVWKLDDDCAEPHLVYVVFPGNVGGVEALTQAVQKFEG